MQSEYQFFGTYILYQGRRIPLDEGTYLLDGGVEGAYKWVYRSLADLAEAVDARVRGTAGRNAVTVYIAPGVYWVHDPDAVDTVRRQEGNDVPYGLVLECDSLHLWGLSEDPGDVVLAGNRGQSHGAVGNYTLFYFKVRDLELDHLTLGNYCSVDLVYEREPRLGRPRRTDAVTQAQLAVQSGDRLLARCCRFVSRLNLRPVSGGERCLYERCHFECTDDALNGRAVYLDCDFDFYGGRPLYDTQGPGAVFLRCLFRRHGESGEESLYFTKEGGAVTVVDCVCQGKEKRFAWTKYPLPSLKCCQYGVMFRREGSGEREPLVIGGRGAAETVFLEGKELLEGYRLETERGVLYNTYNLLRGEDDWDPMGMKEAALRAGRDRVPVFLALEAFPGELAPGGEGSLLRAEAVYFYGKAAHRKVSFYVEEGDEAYVRLTDQGDGSCLVENCLAESGLPSRDAGEEAQSQTEGRKVVVHAVTAEGLEAAVELKVLPRPAQAPEFLEMPVVAFGEGSARVRYRLVPGEGEERSLISWYRCRDKGRGGAVPAAVSRGGRPMEAYPLTWGDVGYELMAQVEPRRSGSARGAAVTACSARAVEERDLCGGIAEEETVESGWLSDGGLCGGTAGGRSVRPCQERGESGFGGTAVEEHGADGTAAEEVWRDVMRKGRSGPPPGGSRFVVLRDREGRKRCVIYATDFSSLPTVRQEKVLPGFWTVDACRPKDWPQEAEWHGDSGGEPWKYGRTGNGSVGPGLYQNVQGARLLYTPGAGCYRDMCLRLKLDPAKTAGQGFGSGGQYMDLCVKFDTASLTGYGVRILRTKDASDGVLFTLTAYEQGKTRFLTRGVMTSCYRTGCRIELLARGKLLTVRGSRAAAAGKPRDLQRQAGEPYAPAVELSAEIEENPFGGIAIWHTGTPGTGGWQNTTMLHFMEAVFWLA